MKTNKTGSSAGASKKVRRQHKKKQKEFERGAKHTRKKEDGLDASLIKWLTPSSGECGVKKLLKWIYKYELRMQYTKDNTGMYSFFKKSSF